MSYRHHYSIHHIHSVYELQTSLFYISYSLPVAPSPRGPLEGVYEVKVPNFSKKMCPIIVNIGGPKIGAARGGSRSSRGSPVGPSAEAPRSDARRCGVGPSPPGSQSLYPQGRWYIASGPWRWSPGEGSATLESEAEAPRSDASGAAKAPQKPDIVIPSPTQDI